MPVVVKIGGSPAEDDAVLEALFRDIAALKESILLVHGGGKHVTDVTRKFGIEPRFSDGIRVTSEAEMPLVDMGLAGMVNTRLVRLAVRSGVGAVGITGADAGTLVGKRVGTGDNATARPDRVDTSLVESLFASRLLPVMAPVASDGSGRAVNVNADDAARAMAGALKATALVFLSDVPGVIDGGRLRNAIRVDSIEDIIAAGVATGGMAAKLRACGEALRAGVGRIAIGNVTGSGDLTEILRGSRGSTIHG